jgi:HK97 family phage prohead protease
MQYTTPLILKRSDFTESGQFEAYAATWDLDDVGDVILRGAFMKALKLHEQTNTTPSLLWQHYPSQPIGRWVSFTEDSKGLLGIGKFTLTTQKGREAFELLKDNALSFSIGFQIDKNGSEVKNGIRYIKSISRLAEVSVVSIPANSAARLVALKKCSPQQLRSFERMLIKSSGLTKKEATGAVCGHWDIKESQEVRLINLLENLTHNIEVSA